jgi:DNA-binding IclR family transcriptional regulator
MEFENAEPLARSDWPTAHELAEASGIPHPTVHERLPDLLRDGFVVKGPKRICRVTGEYAVTWGLPPEAPAAIDLTHAEQEKLF